MAASGATPIILYHSTTAAAVPSNTNLAPGELAVNIADMKLYAENSSGVVTLLADAAAQGTVTSVDVSGGTTGLTTSGGPVTSSGTVTLAGTLAAANGGTGQTTYSNGQLLIGKTDGSLAKATLTAGSNVTITNGDGAITIASTGGGGGSPGGSDTQVQFNDGGSFGGDAGLTYNKTTDVLTVSGGAVLQGLTAGRGGGAVSSNTAFGLNALKVNTTGATNVAVGINTLQANTIGSNNVAIGNQTLFSCTTGSENVCLGFNSGYRVTTGRNNVVVSPLEAIFESNYLSAGTTNNIYMGVGVDFPGGILSWNTSRGFAVDGQNIGRGAGRLTSNVAFGTNALSSNTTGAGNVAIGGEGSGGGVLKNNTIGEANIAIGFRSLENCTTGSSNTSIGFIAGWNVTTGTKNLSVYGGEPPSLANRLSAGEVGLISIGTGDAERLRIETTAFKAQLVYDQTTGSAANVFVASDGKMSRSTSSARYKKNIQDAVHGLDKVLQLRPVTFNHINPDEDGIVYGGLIAEEVHNLGLTEFVEYTWDGRPDSLRYGHMVSLLVKAVQELNARVVALETQGV